MEGSDWCVQVSEHNHKCVVCAEEVLLQVPFSDGASVLPRAISFFHEISRSLFQHPHVLVFFLFFSFYFVPC